MPRMISPSPSCPKPTDDAVPIERLHERTFGPGRYALTAFRIREGIGHDLRCRFTARIGTLLVVQCGCSRCDRGARRCCLAPLTIEPPFRDRGIGLAMMQRALGQREERGPHAGDPGRRRTLIRPCGLQARPRGRVKMPGPVDPARSLVIELTEALVRRPAGGGVAPARVPARRIRAKRNGATLVGA